MKKIAVEIRTTYLIELGMDDFIEVAKGKYKTLIQDETLKRFGEGSITVGEIHEFIKSFGINGKAADYQAVAHTFGYMGCSNAGYYNAKNHTHIMEVYNAGADNI